MINSHKELISEIQLFADKFDLINDFKYIKDVDLISGEVKNSEPRVLVVGLDSMTFDKENYNQVVMYKFVLADMTINDTDSILESESENMFCISALGDYLDYVADAPIEFQVVSFVTESDADSTYTSVSGNFEFIIKRKPSYWKVMEEYSVS